MSVTANCCLQKIPKWIYFGIFSILVIDFNSNVIMLHQFDQK